MRICYLFICLFIGSLFLGISITDVKAQPPVVLQENFTSYQGNAATAPAGWYFSFHGNYTSTVFSGMSGPNSYKFGLNNATVITPSFSNVDLLRFWLKGSGTDTASYLIVYSTADSIVWDTVALIKPVPTSGTTMSYSLNNSVTHLKFVYTKSAGNVAFDDFLLLSGKIIAYFNTPVNTSVATTVPAIYLNNYFDDILISYINRARYTIDVEMYQYIQDSTISDIASAINNAYSRGVRVRWIYDNSTNNNSLLLLNGNIPKLPSPTGGPYGFMHNKFFIFDANSPNANDAIVWTGSGNITPNQINRDANNTIIIRDPNIAQAYLTEFSEMWGDTGIVPNPANSKFGPFKTDNTPHLFNVGGVPVEVYFSPSDGTNSKILQSIGSANKDMYFGIYLFAYDPIADSIKNKIQNKNIYTAGIMDNQSQQFSAYTLLSSVMGNMLQVQNLTAIYHNKFLIVDACDSLSGPLVLTGSHNWSLSADTKNDENTIIIHDATIANIYYQAFNYSFTNLGGTLATCSTLAVNELSEDAGFMVFPNPTSGKFQIRGLAPWRTMAPTMGKEYKIETYNVYGEKVAGLLSDRVNELNPTTQQLNNSITLNLSSHPNGIYFLKIKTEKGNFVKKIIISH